jgi:hypothetical protein
MKKLSIVILVSLVFGLSGCEDVSTSTPTSMANMLIGTWRYEDGSGSVKQYTFTATDFTYIYTATDPLNNRNESGKYAINGSLVVLSPDVLLPGHSTHGYFYFYIFDNNKKLFVDYNWYPGPSVEIYDRTSF